MTDKIEFMGTLPTHRTAIHIDGEGAVKVNFDADAEQLVDIVEMALGMRGKLLRVSVEVVEE